MKDIRTTTSFFFINKGVSRRLAITLQTIPCTPQPDPLDYDGYMLIRILPCFQENMMVQEDPIELEKMIA